MPDDPNSSEVVQGQSEDVQNDNALDDTPPPAERPKLIRPIGYYKERIQPPADPDEQENSNSIAP